MKFTCPASMIPHAMKVLDGEYDVPGVTFEKPPVFLDIGANVGAFAVWAKRRWPDAKLHCFEPLPENFALLKANTAGFDDVRVVESAVGRTYEVKRLRFGKNNCGEASFHELGEQAHDGIDVVVISAGGLPSADVWKIDTEGCEVEILEALALSGTQPPTLVLLEFHRAKDRRRIDELLIEYNLVGADIRSADRGVLKYVRRDLPAG